jgi:proline racemase
MDPTTTITVEAMIRCNGRVLMPDDVTAGATISKAFDGVQRRMQFRVADVNPATDSRCTDIVATAMLSVPSSTTIDFESITIAPPTAATPRTEAGSVTVTTCFLEGRIIRMITPLRVRHQRTDDGIIIDVATSERGIVSIDIVDLTGRVHMRTAYENAGSYQQATPSTTTVRLPTHGITSGLYLIVVRTASDMQTDRLLLHE